MNSHPDLNTSIIEHGDDNQRVAYTESEDHQPTGHPDPVPPGETERNSKTTPPPKCLVFSIYGPMAHFRRVETSQTRLSYRIPPRTTTAGLLAAILGYDIDSYYQAFTREHAALAVEICEPLRTITMPISHRTVDDEHTTNIGDSTLSFDIIEPSSSRQRVAHEILRNPQYRIFVWLSNNTAYTKLKSHLERGTCVYTPSLGLSEYLATIQYEGEYNVAAANKDKAHVDSIVPEDGGEIHQPDTPVIAERVPAAMERIHTPLPGRRTTEFLTYHFRNDGEPIQVSSADLARVNDKTVIFS